MTEPGATPELDHDVEWQRLDPRMLLIHPIKEVSRFIVPLVFVVVAGSTTGGGGFPWEAILVIVPIALGVIRYLTTTFRISAGRVELRRGLLNRHNLSVQVDRVRTVDMTSDLIHRALGLTTVTIGTGTASTNDDEKISLDGLPVERARELRVELLQQGSATQTAQTAPTAQATTAATQDLSQVPGLAPGPVEAEPAAPEQTLLGFVPAWCRFAPLTGTGFAITAAMIGLAFSLVGQVGVSIGGDTALPMALWALALIVVGGLLVSVVVTSIVGYLMAYWNFRLTRSGATFHISRGLLTTRETTLDVARVAGVQIVEPITLRPVRAAGASAIVTGLSGAKEGASGLTPPAPRAIVTTTAAAVLGSSAPLTGPLVEHGPAAVRRRYTRALVPAVLLGVIIAGGLIAIDAPAWVLATAVLPLLVAGPVALDRAHSLGHRLADGFVVSRAGSLLRTTAVLGTDHVIGWNLRSSWFQRRVGLTTLVATTAGGSQRVTILDLPEDQAVAMAHDSLPRVVGQFLA